MKLRPMATQVDVSGSTILRDRPLDEILDFCRDGSEQPGNLIVHGPSGSGKTTLLTQSHEIMRLITPTAFVNCNDYRPETVPDLFRDIRDQLSARIPGLPRCHFPRLDLVLTALRDDLTPVSDYTRFWPELVKHWRRQARSDRGVRRERRGGTATSVSLVVEVNLLFLKFQIGAVRPVGPALALPRRKIDTAVEQWFKARSWGSLINPYPEHVGTEEAERDRETEWRIQTSHNEWLVHAFLADLRDQAGDADQYRRVVLLDDVDALKQPASRGGGLLALFRSVQSSPAHQGVGRTPLLLVSSTPEKPHMTRTKAIPAPDFSPAEVRELADRTPRRIDDYFPELIYGLTGGYVAATSYLLQDPAIDGLRAYNGLQHLLRQKRGGAEDAPTLKEHLGDTLIKALLKHSELDLASRTLEALTICSLAKDLQDVDYLIRTYGLGEDLTGLDDHRWLAWNENSGAARSARTLMMRLLLRRWQKEPTWVRCDRDEAFRRLAKRSDEGASGHTPNWYYYTLGAGDLMAVCRELDALLDLPGRESGVLELIRHTTSVPQPPIDDPGADGFTPLQRYGFLVRNRGPRRSNGAPLGHRLSRILRIVAGKWVIEDPFESMYTRDVHLRVRTAFHELGAVCEDSRPFQSEAEYHENISLERPVNPLDAEMDF
ncbi:ATP-binding protein [Nocardiopsis aegyptia]|uniref:Cdc6-like AAA superfamily ATPase n=1 Tax=Nocardiopsis aegyptia TaxID=220378 RepID=A0A7Z0EJ29_9ACTN|nr:ATP-binding protein [Nocardiopsis aegyptia]NYJ32511.1 Cdc6-like AAA superfamily ATPase [Nocardiopsis aegyptia]